jgi:hypothetical protein
MSVMSDIATELELCSPELRAYVASLTDTDTDGDKPFTEMSAVEWLEELEGLLAKQGIPQTYIIASLGRKDGITFMPKQWYDTWIRTHNETLAQLAALGVEVA